VETVLSNLISSIGATIKQSLAKLLDRFIPQSPTLSSEMIDVLHVVWQQPTATQLLLIVTQILLHNALLKCVNSTSGTDSRDTMLNDCYDFFTSAIDMFTDVLRQPDRLQQWVKPEDSHSGESAEMLRPTTPAALDSEILPSTHDTIAEPSQVARSDSSYSQQYLTISMKNLIIVLLYYRGVVERLINRQLVPSIEVNTEDGGTELQQRKEKDFDVQSIIHYTWSDDKVLKLEGLESNLEYGNQFIGGGHRLVLTLDTERHMLYLMKAVTEMTRFAMCVGRKVHCTHTYVCIYVCHYLCVCVCVRVYEYIVCKIEKLRNASTLLKGSILNFHSMTLVMRICLH